MRGAMPDEGSIIVLMGKTAMDKESYNRLIPRIREDKTLFPSNQREKETKRPIEGLVSLQDRKIGVSLNVL